MRAIILAAGEGTRLRPHTLERPKCMVELQGVPLLHYQLRALKASGIEDITVVTGYRRESIEALGVATRHNPDYASTNMVETLMCASDLLAGDSDVLIAYADIVYEPRIIKALANCDDPLSTTVDRDWLRLWKARAADPIQDAETLRLDDLGFIQELGRKPESLDQIEAQYMGLVKATREFAPTLVSVHQALDPDAKYEGKDLRNMYMTSFLQHLIDTGHPLKAVQVDGGWLEIDTVKDLELFDGLAKSGDLRKFFQIDKLLSTQSPS